MSLANRDERDFESCSVYRSDVDDRVWMCNIPYVDVAQGLQASTSLRRIKAYVEEQARRHLNYVTGKWVASSDGDGWNYVETDGEA